MIALLLAASLLPKSLDAVLNVPDLQGAVVGALVMDKDGKVLYERNAGLRLIPASNQKMLSCAYAIAELGPDAVITTRFWKTEDGLIVDAPGDPSITLAKLRAAREALGAPANGRVLARQAFRVGPPPSWEWDDLPFTYAAPIAALTFDEAAWALFAEKGEIVPPPSELGIQIKRRRMTGELEAVFDPWAKTVEVSGPLPSARTQIARFALPDPDRVAARILGGTLHSFDGSLPERAPDHIIVSAPISQLIKDCLEPSDNLYAEHLMLHTAGKQGLLPGDNEYVTAAQRMRAFLAERLGVGVNGLRPVDGSGLSRQNLVTPLTLVKLLSWTDSQPWARLYQEALAAPGEGTLRTRLQSVKFAGKTGTINAVSSLSGILNPGESNRLYISIVMNSATAPSSRLRAIQDRFVEACRDWVNNVESQEPAASAYDHADTRDSPADGRRLR